MVFTGSADGTVKVWKREQQLKGTKHSLNQTLLQQECAVTSLAIGAPGSVLYCGSSDGLVNFWELEKGLAHGGVLKGHKLAVLCLEGAGNLVFSGSADKTICVWRRDGNIHTCLSVLTGHTGPLNRWEEALARKGKEQVDRLDSSTWRNFTCDLYNRSAALVLKANKILVLQMEGLSVADANLLMYLHPSKSRNVSQSILRELGSLLFKFNETFDGVLLAYDVNILDKQAKILSGVHPYFGLRLKANLLLFSPKPDMLLEGKVVKLSQESIHVIVLGFSSAIITAENIRGEFKYRTKDKEELFASKSHKRHVIKVGTMIRFLVKSFDEEILHIIGSLISAHTGSIRWLDRHLEEDSEFDRSSMKSRDREWLGDKTVDEGATPMSYDNHIKMSKKRRITE
ncbi:hypothetical protein GOBAR_AA24202 [Gossypium barbadense]|uniref:Uncharacterized protein n=5 Tax=Gossypium TaxID=3633 RepID=A0A2P5WZG1_GOSBA|nr:hypothetical protein GOBAR_AA24202 [Gossypium barbadense]